MCLTPADQKWLGEYEQKSDEALALLSIYTGPGLDSLNRAALAKFVLDSRHAKIRDGREERTFQQAERALEISKEASHAASKQARLAILAIIISFVSAAISAAALYLK